MGKIYYIMGKSATGKDTLYAKLQEECPKLKKITLYTTRPKREDETDGVEYNFISKEKLEEFKRANKVIESRTYKTMYGDWSYATIDDGKIKINSRSYIVIGTLESYKKVLEYFGKENIFPIYISVDAGIRLQRALNRENRQEKPKYDEVCRRFLADEEDFSSEKLLEAGINKKYINDNLKECLDEIISDMEFK